MIKTIFFYFIAEKYVTITDLQDDLNLMREVTSMLNDSARVKTFKDLAEECGIPLETYRSLQPSNAESPIEEVLKDIVWRNPYYTVDELIIDLREMKRVDVIKALRRHFDG